MVIDPCAIPDATDTCKDFCRICRDTGDCHLHIRARDAKYKAEAHDYVQMMIEKKRQDQSQQTSIKSDARSRKTLVLTTSVFTLMVTLIVWVKTVLIESHNSIWATELGLVSSAVIAGLVGYVYHEFTKDYGDD